MAKGTDPSWSPDGRLLMFKAPRPDNILIITTMNVSTGENRSLAPGVHPHFAPDGTSIVYMFDGRERADVYVMRVDGSGQRCLTCGWK